MVAVGPAVPGGVGAIVGVQLQGVGLVAVAVAAEAVGGHGEGDVRFCEVIAEAVGEEEGLGRSLLRLVIQESGSLGFHEQRAVVPRSAAGHPSGGGGVNSQASSSPCGLGELGERVEEVVAGRWVHELGGLGDVVVVDVGEHVRERALELGRPGREPPRASKSTVTGALAAALSGFGSFSAPG